MTIFGNVITPAGEFANGYADEMPAAAYAGCMATLIPAKCYAEFTATVKALKRLISDSDLSSEPIGSKATE